tara:strand:+ start:131 stop:325 length:195 start_codon:yes stop_codon:yes gene_type:complete
MKHYYVNGKEIIEYKLVTDPLEAMYWSTYRLKKSHIKISNKISRPLATQIKQEIYDDIKQTETK